MRAAVLPAYGRPLELTDLPDPVPGAGEVVIEMLAAGVCQTDVHLAAGTPSILPFLPWTLGHEVAGRVLALGAGVSGVAEGDAVAVFGGWGCGQCACCTGGVEQLCDVRRWQGLGRPGGFAERLLVPAARHLVPLGGLDPVAAAPLTDAGLTSYRAVRAGLSRLRPGSTALVQGLGGLGQYAVQYLRLLSPARVIGVDPSADRRAEALTLGAHDVLDPAEGDLGGAVRRLTGGDGVNVVLDIVAADSTLALSVASVSRSGLVVVVGASGSTLHLKLRGLPSEVTVMTTVWGSRAELAEVIELAAEGLVQGLTTTYPLADAQRALEDLAAGRVAGRAVLVP